MVIIYFFFGYQKWFDYEAQGLIPFFTHGPLIFWMYPVLGIKGSSYFLGVSEWLFGAFVAGRFLEQEAGSARSSGVGAYVYHDCHDHPIYAGRLGTIGRRISCDGRECRLPDERRSPAGRVVLSAEAGCCKSGGGC